MGAVKGNKRSSPGLRGTVDVPPGGFEVDISPDASALRLFKNMSFTPWYAIGEFVDNSITSALRELEALRKAHGRHYRLEIGIEFTDDHALVVTDNAAGISKQELSRALRTGKPPQDLNVGLSRHGVGMKAAGFWWGRKIEIQTWPLGESTGWRVEIDLGEDDGSTQGVVVVHPIKRGRHISGTVVKIHGLWKKKPQTGSMGAIRGYLPSIYRMYLSDQKKLPCTITLNGRTLEFTDPEELVAPFWPSVDGPDDNGDKTWKRGVSILLSSGKMIRGAIGILKKMSRDHSGFLLHYRGKGISGVRPALDDEQAARDAAATGAYKPRAIFGQSGSYRDQSYFGEFDVSSFGKSITTDSIQWTQEEEQEFIDKLLELMRKRELDFWTMADNFRRRRKETPKSDQKLFDEETKTVVGALDRQLSHAPAPPPTSSRRAPTSPTDFEAEASFKLDDLDGHTHEFHIAFTTEPSTPFLALTTPRKHTHRVVINEAHISLAKIPMQQDATRKLTIRLGIALAAAEIFSNGRDLHQVRDKMNEILYRLGRRDMST